MEKEVILQFSGKWRKGIKKIKFTQEDIIAVEQAIIDGKLLSEILTENKLDRETLDIIFKKYIHLKEKDKPQELPKQSTFILGKKTLWDFKTEREMLEEEPYTWESLSQAERDFYLNYKL